jgi:hypothetical protein
MDPRQWLIAAAVVVGYVARRRVRKQLDDRKREGSTRSRQKTTTTTGDSFRAMFILVDIASLFRVDNVDPDSRRGCGGSRPISGGARTGA